MEKSSLLKILMSLSILSLYVFLFGMVGVIEPVSSWRDAKEAKPVFEPVKTDAPDEPPEAPATTINTANQRKPGLADYNAPVLPRPPERNGEPGGGETLPEISKADETGVTFVIDETAETDEPGGEIDVIGETDEPATSAPEETTAETTATATETPPPETSPPEPTAETLRVVSGGAVVEGNAADIVARVVQNEIGSSFNKEAIKAQAVAAYTYIKRHNALNSTPSLTLAPTASDRVKECVGEVAGQGAYYNGELIQAVFSASSAGYSSSAANVWGEDLPYLKSVKCAFDEEYDPNYGLTKVFTSNEVMLKVLKETGIELSGDPAGWFKVSGWVDTVYVGEMSIGGNTSYSSGGNEVKITGRVFRERIMGLSELRSAAFDISYDRNRDAFTFTTYGYGHGAGLSQNGANILANRQGYDYIEILKHYYTGIEVK
ncbi:MAG: SpoIID/LytB domain-containing protein [Oscillospiraceae bacterium]|jgi:stage II sporulation protein D|nr:SpoIID/LytB domain-containing protein [Oscillospiraceae bacterium]